MLASEGDEGGFSEGLVIPMKVEKFDTLKSKEKVPHMGWNNIFTNNNKSVLLEGIPTILISILRIVIMFIRRKRARNSFLQLHL